MKSLVRVKGLCYDLEFGVSLPNFLWSPLDDAKFSRLQAIRPTPGAKVEDISLKTTWLKRREEWILQIPQRFKILTVYFTILWYQTLGFTPVCEVYVACFSHVRPLATSWTAAYQAPRSTGFSRQEYWSGVPLPSPKIAFTLRLILKHDIFEFLLIFPRFSISLFSGENLNSF